MKCLVLALLIPAMSFGQSDLETAIRGSEILLTSLTAWKMAKSDPNAKIIGNVCVKNKLDSGITFTVTGKDDDDEEITKELVIAKGSKECIFNLPKGIYTYVVLLPDETVYKKGEYKIDGEMTIVIKGE